MPLGIPCAGSGTSFGDAGIECRFLAMPRDLPMGVVTLLFTDVEGSTRLLQELGDGYGDALLEHRRRLRAAFAEHDGVEVDTQGDAFFVAFSRASDAVAAAEDAQRALADGSIRVRMGLHTGEPRLSEEGYVGLDVHKGARIAAVGHGGQVLLSSTTRALVDADVRDLGPHRLKDLSSPEQHLPARGRRAAVRLPAAENARGRDEEPALTGHVVRRPCVGARGDRPAARGSGVPPADARRARAESGKTRLALEAAARRIDRYPHGVHFVPLVSVRVAGLPRAGRRRSRSTSPSTARTAASRRRSSCSTTSASARPCSCSTTSSTWSRAPACSAN